MQYFQLAVIDDDPQYLKVISDFLRDYKPDLYDNPSKLKQSDYSLYDLIIIDHNINGLNWRKLYSELKTGTPAHFMVVATFDKAHYDRINEPLLTSDNLKDPRIMGASQKYDHRKIKRWVEFQITRMESLFLAKQS